ncbi:hypothetical protein NDI47_18940 [Microcoleus vaginatus GB1-A2]|uniref:hypothetical protein n=1 Tax=Microcoleus vaginatus TaxID=119532 RepID=UPI00168644A8|nr:hypothetical protein [Microcoleus sp. FACHB-61]
MGIQKPSFRRNLKFLGGSVVGLAGLLAVWIVGGNYMASVQEKEIEQDLAAYAQRFPKTQPNDAALKLVASVAKLGFSGGGASFSSVDRSIESRADFRSSEDDRKAFEEIRPELKQYLDAEIAKPNDTVNPPSEKLQRYLASRQTALAELRQQVLNNEVPHWGTDISWILEGDITVARPSYLWPINFQQVLALDILEKYRKGQTQAAAEMLEVSWKINQSLTENPSLISQLVGLIVTKYTAGVMRKVDRLPAQWQQRLLEHDYPESILTSLQGEYFFKFKFLQNFVWKYSWSSIQEPSGAYNLVGIFVPFRFPNEPPTLQEKILDWTLSHVLVWFKPTIEPYVRFCAIDTYQVYKRRLAASRQQNVCASDSVTVDDFAWWNYIGRISTTFPSQFTSKGAKSMLDLELTQKILQVKALAAKTGKWPPSVPDMKSSICPGAKWLYRVAPDGTMSISFSEKPKWLEERLKYKRWLPFTYSDKTPPQLKNRSSTRPKR